MEAPTREILNKLRNELLGTLDGAPTKVKVDTIDGLFSKLIGDMDLVAHKAIGRPVLIIALTNLLARQVYENGGCCTKHLCDQSFSVAEGLLNNITRRWNHDHPDARVELDMERNGKPLSDPPPPAPDHPDLTGADGENKDNPWDPWQKRTIEV